MNTRGRWWKGIGLASLICSAAIPVVLTAEETLEERVARLERQLADNDAGGAGFEPAKAEWLSLGGEWEFEFVDTESDQAADASANSHARFQHDKFLLIPTVTLTDNLFMTGELQFETGGAQIEEWHAHFLGLPLDTWLQVGWDERITYANGKFDMANRTTEAYPLLGTAFWRDEAFQLIWGGEHAFEDVELLDAFKWRLSWGDGLELNEKQPSEDDSYELTHDNDLASDTIKHKKEWGLGAVLGFTPPVEDYAFDIGLFLITGNLNNDERTRLAGITGYSTIDPSATASIDDDQERFHIRTTHTYRDFSFTYEMAEATDGKLDREASYFQFAYKYTFAEPLLGEWVRDIQPLVRIEDYEVEDIVETFGDAETWDREQTVLAVAIGLASNTKLRLEYYINEEDTGGTGGPTDPRDPDNDEFLMQLEIKF